MKLVVAGLIVIFMFACSSRTFFANPKVVLNEPVFTEENSKAAWMAYATAIVLWEPVFLKNGAKDLFNREVFAREAVAKIWTRYKLDHPNESDANLDDLAKVRDAGFISEYVFVYLKPPGWRAQQHLHIDDFDLWRKEHLKYHQPIRYPVIFVSDT